MKFDTWLMLEIAEIEASTLHPAARMTLITAAILEQMRVSGKFTTYAEFKTQIQREFSGYVLHDDG